MKKISKVCCLFLALIFNCTLVQAQSDLVDIIIPHNNYSLTPIIDIYIGDKGPYKFVIDTGASQSSISRKLADEIGLSYKKQSSSSTLTANSIIFKDITESLDLYISEHKVHRRTDLFITDHDFNTLTKARGILGVAQFQDGVLENHPDHKALKLTIHKTVESCELLNEQSKCYKNISKLLPTKFSLGDYNGDLLIDTGNQGTRYISLFKSQETNRLWNRVHHELPEVKLDGLSDKPLRLLRTQDFSLNGQPCIGEVLLRDPYDKAPKLEELIGFIGWSVLQSMSFKIDYKNDHVSFTVDKCPYDNVKTIGISGVYTSKDFRYMYVEDFIAGSSADRLGIKRHDQVEKIILANGKVITKFDNTLYNHNDQHVYAPVGSKVTYFVRREGELKPFVMTAEGVHLVDLD